MDYALEQVVEMVCEGDITTVKGVVEELYHSELEEAHYFRADTDYVMNNKRCFLAGDPEVLYQEAKERHDNYYRKAIADYWYTHKRLMEMSNQIKSKDWTGFEDTRDKLIKALEWEASKLYKPTQKEFPDISIWYNSRLHQLDEEIEYYEERNRSDKEVVDKHNKNRLELLKLVERL